MLRVLCRRRVQLSQHTNHSPKLTSFFLEPEDAALVLGSPAGCLRAALWSGGRDAETQQVLNTRDREMNTESLGNAAGRGYLSTESNYKTTIETSHSTEEM